MIAVSTFSGVGGLDLGLERAGIQTVLQAESDEWCREILAHRFPHAAQIPDVRDVTLEAVTRRLEELDEQREGAPVPPSGGERPGAGLDEERRPLQRGPLEHRPGHHRDHGGVDVLHGGFPCQDVSVAGNRAGLAGERTGLFFEFARIADALRPRWVLLENVPGLLTSNGGRDFGVVLATLADLGYGVGWRVLDSRYFGVPQRRRRVFIVGRSGGDGASALRALCEGCGGSAPARASSWQAAALRARAGAHGDGEGADPSYWIEDSENGTLRAGGHGGAPPRSDRNPLLVTPATAATLSAGGHPNSAIPGRRQEDDVNLIAHTLTAGGADASEDGSGRGTPLVATDVAPTLMAGGEDSYDPEFQAFVATDPRDGGRVAETLGRGHADRGIDVQATHVRTVAPLSTDAAGGRSGDAETPSADADGIVRLRPPGLGVGEAGDPSFTISASGPPGVATYEVTMDGDEVGGLKARRTDIAPTLTTIQEGKKTDRGIRVVTPPVAMSVAENQRGELLENDTAGALARAGGKPGQGRPTARTASGVRRLTPVECERLQAFPDGWTEIPGVKCPDSRRYAAMGNAVTVNVAEWIGHRMMAEDAASGTLCP